MAQFWRVRIAQCAKLPVFVAPRYRIWLLEMLLYSSLVDLARTFAAKLTT